MKFWQAVTWAETDQLIELETFKNREASGMTSGLNMPFAFALGAKSTLDAKKFYMEDFAKRIIHHFSDEQ